MTEVFVDANVLLRLLTGDPPQHAARAAALMRRAEAGEIRVRLTPLVVAEVVRTLSSFYRLPRDEVADVVTRVITAPGVTTDEALVLVAALRTMATANVAFVDAYLAERARLGGGPVASFDRDFERLDVETVPLVEG